ncbi:desulfoferrodoxin [Ruminococcaceae bacterium OttesenSCG-928-I18]|nr:desulfoferrodoxin [Ruminococcaceae bacterium OttesenSCG-928-I18]
MANFYKCDDCGEIVLEMSAPQTACPNKNKELLEPNSSDGAGEKHVPVVSKENGQVKVQVGSVPHPMIEEHHIEWIYVKTTFGGIYCNLEAGDPPEALFSIKADEVEEVYEYCNLHGLWKAPNPQLDLGVDFEQNNAACSPEFTDGCVNPSGTPSGQVNS